MASLDSLAEEERDLLKERNGGECSGFPFPHGMEVNDDLLMGVALTVNVAVVCEDNEECSGGWR